MKILLTGFKPFGENESNPTLEIIEQLKKQRKENIETLQLDVFYDADGKKVIEEIKRSNPALVLSFGLAGGRDKICFEAQAENLRNASIADNQGIILKNEKINEEGMPFYQSNIDINKLNQAFKYPDFKISYSVGTYVCNDVYYQVLDYIYREKLLIACGFIHVPYVVPKKDFPYIEINRVVQVISDLMDFIIKDFTFLS